MHHPTVDAASIVANTISLSNTTMQSSKWWTLKKTALPDAKNMCDKKAQNVEFNLADQLAHMHLQMQLFVFLQAAIAQMQAQGTVLKIASANPADGNPLLVLEDLLQMPILLLPL